MNKSSSSGSLSRYGGIGLPNTIHSDVAPRLPLPLLPVFCGASDLELRFSDETGIGISNSWSNARRTSNSSGILSQASKIEALLREADVSYLNLREDARVTSWNDVEPLPLYEEVLHHYPEAFEYRTSGCPKEQILDSTLHDKKLIECNLYPTQQQRELVKNRSQQVHNVLANDVSTSSKKSKVRKKVHSEVPSSIQEDPVELQADNIIGSFCEMLEDLCGRAEITGDERGESEWLPLPLADIRKLVNEIMSIRAKKLLHMVDVNILFRLLRSDSDVIPSVLCALESIHAALAVMSHNHMPKQLYREEIIERILEYSRHQIMDIMYVYDPSYRALHKPRVTGIAEDCEDEDLDVDFSSGKRCRSLKSVKTRKYAVNRVSSAASTMLQKLCSILGLLKDLLLIEKLSDSCILQLVRTSFTTFLVDNIQLLQLKAIALTSAVEYFSNLNIQIFYSYNQHRTYVIDEILQLLWKLPFSKRAVWAYLLPDEEQRQIQIVTALLIQLVHYSANLPEVRYTSAKPQDAMEVKVLMENIVMDLMTTLNLPEYPASAPILEVFCVLLLQNAGLKSKDVSARSMAIDLLGTIAARLKRDTVIHKLDKFWIIQELNNEENATEKFPGELCSICLDGRVEKFLFACQSCQRSFHSDCMGVREQEVPSQNWNCQLCICRKQLMVLQSFCKSQCKENKRNSAEIFGPITNVEIVQLLLLNYLQDSGSADDLHLFVCWFYLCLWCKDDPKSQQKLYYYLSKLKSRTIVRESKTVSSALTRDSVKNITLALGKNNSFTRGFDKILHMLLASLRENSPVIRAKALRAVSIIVEADPEVLCDKRVQLAVEGRFCDSAISVREAALELKVADRIKDTGVSVRKRAIKIIRDMCTSRDNFSEFTSACIEIIMQVTDDESSIQDLVCKTFYEFWFEEPSGSQARIFSNGSSVPMEVTKKAEQIVDMLRRMPNYQLLVSVIKRNLTLDFFPQSTKAAGINPVLFASVHKRCELICKCLLEKILQVEESTTDQSELQTLPYVLVLHAFCMVDPTFCAPASDPSQFVVTLQPYLKSRGNNRAVAQLLESIIFIMDSVFPLLRKLQLSVIEELEQDLKHMIVRHSFMTVVHACIKCLCSVTKVAGKGSVAIEYLIQLFFKHLYNHGAENKQQLGRSIFCLGLLIRYGNSLLSLTNSRRFDIASSLSLFKRYLKMDDFVLKVRALQALGFVLIARPEFMLEKDIGEIIEATFSSDADSRLKMQALQNMYEYLLDTESQMGTEKTGYCSSMPTRRKLYYCACCCRGLGNMRGRSECAAFSQARLGVSRIYKLIRGNWNSRNKFMSSIVRKFDNPQWNNSVVPFMMHCTEILALLPFTLPDEPLNLIFSINTIIQVRAGSIEANLKAFCSRLFLRGSQDIDHENGVIQQDKFAQTFFGNVGAVDLNGSAQEDSFCQQIYGHMGPLDLDVRIPPEAVDKLHTNAGDYVDGQTHFLLSTEPCGLSDNDLQKIQVDCLAAIALQPASSEAEKAFSPTESVKSGETLPRQNIPFTLGTTQTDLPSTPQEVLPRYQEFKNALREDTIDYGIYTSCIKPKRPAPRRISKRPLAGDDEDDCDEDYAGGARLTSSYRRRQPC
ncbi:hypothetical protein SAY86_006801 [Trapa natans]|uniref:Sister chromatid cohesion protein n=1 Tax=Trapa natans TaxID=22666 RepID=A0AAN7LAG1_TRANT|nr:hypothetical protein SAY86_006801 [Trapa natans]